MNKKDFFELTGENPEDILGNDWENIVDKMGGKMKSDEKVIEAIKATNEFIKKCNENGNNQEFSDYGLTIYGCEKRNLKEYKEILGKDKRKLTGRLRELYQAI